MNIKKILMGGGLAAAVALVVFAGVSIASAALTFSGTSIMGDSNSIIDTTGTISIGTNSATGITIGQSGQTVLFPGNVSSTNFFTGNATTTNLAITALGTSASSSCLTVNAAGNVATTTCGGGSGTNYWSTTSTGIYYNGTGTVAAPALVPTGAGAISLGTVSNFQVSATNPVSNYVAAGYVEVESNGTCESVSQQGGSWTYSTATDPYCEGWSTGVPITGLSGVYNPGGYNGGFSIAKSGSTYYMIVDNAGRTAGAGALYVLSATALAGPWTVQNSGNPVLSAGSSTSYTYYMYNPALTIVGSNWLLLLEGGSNTVTDANTSYSFATGCPSSCSFTANLTATPVFGANNGLVDSLGAGTAAGSPQLIYVPDESEIVALLTHLQGGRPSTDSYLQAYTISSASPSALATFGNWASAPGFQVWLQGTPAGLSDPRLYFSPTVGLKGFNAILSTYTNSSLGTWQLYSPLTIDQWYQSITTPPSPPVPPVWSNENGSGPPLMSTNPYGPVQFNLNAPNAVSTSTPYALRGIVFDSGGASGVSGVQGSANFQNATASSTDTIRGITGQVLQSSAGYNISNLIAGYFGVGFNYSSGTVTNAYDLYAYSPTSPGGTTTINQYGLYINTQHGYSTNSYGIYQQSGLDSNVLDGPTTVNSTLVGSPGSTSGSTSQQAIRGFQIASNTGGTVVGVQGQVNLQGGSANDTGSIIGVQGLAVPNQAYTLATAKGGDFQVQPQSTSDLVTNAYGLEIESPSNGAAITTDYGLYVASQAGPTTHYGVYVAGTTDPSVFSGGISVGSARKGTFVCTAGGTITITNTNELATSDVIISLNTAAGTISTAPAMKTVTAGTGFTVLCGAADTSTYNYDILN